MMPVMITGWVLAILGLGLAAGGVWLGVLGGSWAYIVMGLLLLASGMLLARRRYAALGLYAVLLLGTLAWALWEAGLDRWALVPRGAFLAMVGLWLLTPWIRNGLLPGPQAYRVANAADRPGRSLRARWQGARTWLGVAMLLVIAVTLASLWRDDAVIEGTLRAVAAASAPAVGQLPNPAEDWVAYGGSGYGQRYSSLASITPETVHNLKLVWTYHAGDQKGDKDPEETTFEVTPLKIGAMLYLCTPHSVVIALDAATGVQRWRYDPKAQVGHGSQHATCRGLAYRDLAADWVNTAANPLPAQSSAPGGATAVPAAAGNNTAPATPPAAVPAVAPAPSSPQSATTPAVCTQRLFLSTIDARLIALDAASGRPCDDFGSGGMVNLGANMPNLKPGYYMQTSPPVATRDLVIVGGSINDNESVHNPSGVIRAFDLKTGRLVWNWDPGNPDATAPIAAGQTYTAGAPNNWSVASVDEALGMVYIPLGNQSPDQLGAGRTPQIERFSSSVVALDIATGQLRWVFQTVHHDLWDRDVPAQPSLVDLDIGGSRVPALIQPTKQGDIYVLDRRDGQPLLPVREVATPRSTLPGETASPQQPASGLSFLPPPLLERDMWGATPWDQLACRIEFRSMGYAGPYTPPATKRTLVYPGNLGVFNWGGVAVDPQRQIMVATPNHLAFTYQMVPRRPDDSNVISAGQDEHWNENYGGPYAVKIGPFESPLKLPCQQPPWGLVVGVDLRNGHVAWQRRDGTVQDKMPSFLPIPFAMGVPSLGGPLITAGGVAFYSGTSDYFLRAYEVSTGRELWQARLPAGGQATPMSYSVNGRQMVVVAAGGHGSFGTKTGDAILAFALD